MTDEPGEVARGCKTVRRGFDTDFDARYDRQVKAIDTWVMPWLDEALSRLVSRTKQDSPSIADQKRLHGHAAAYHIAHDAGGWKDIYLPLFNVLDQKNRALLGHVSLMVAVQTALLITSDVLRDGNPDRLERVVMVFAASLLIAYISVAILTLRGLTMRVFGESDMAKIRWATGEAVPLHAALSETGEGSELRWVKLALGQRGFDGGNEDVTHDTKDGQDGHFARIRFRVLRELYVRTKLYQYSLSAVTLLSILTIVLILVRLIPLWGLVPFVLVGLVATGILVNVLMDQRRPRP